MEFAAGHISISELLRITNLRENVKNFGRTVYPKKTRYIPNKIAIASVHKHKLANLIETEPADEFSPPSL
jgi:hypothetical protein